MDMERIHPAIFEVTLHAYELSGRIATARWPWRGPSALRLTGAPPGPPIAAVACAAEDESTRTITGSS